jgi:hypothetical protein
LREIEMKGAIRQEKKKEGQELPVSRSMLALMPLVAQEVHRCEHAAADPIHWFLVLMEADEGLAGQILRQSGLIPEKLRESLKVWEGQREERLGRAFQRAEVKADGGGLHLFFEMDGQPYGLRIEKARVAVEGERKGQLELGVQGEGPDPEVLALLTSRILIRWPGLDGLLAASGYEPSKSGGGLVRFSFEQDGQYQAPKSIEICWPENPGDLPVHEGNPAMTPMGTLACEVWEEEKKEDEEGLESTEGDLEGEEPPREPKRVFIGSPGAGQGQGILGSAPSIEEAKPADRGPIIAHSPAISPKPSSSGCLTALLLFLAFVLCAFFL